MTTLTRRRLVEEVPYTTSPGDRVRSLVTDLARFDRDERGELVLAAVAAGDTPVAERVAEVRARVPWDLRTTPTVEELAPVDRAQVERLRRWDPQGRFLRPGD